MGFSLTRWKISKISVTPNKTITFGNNILQCYSSLTNLYLLTADLHTRVHSQFCDQIMFIEVRTLFIETAAVNSRNANRTLQPVGYGFQIYQQESMKA